MNGKVFRRLHSFSLPPLRLRVSALTYFPREGRKIDWFNFEAAFIHDHEN